MIDPGLINRDGPREKAGRGLVIIISGPSGVGKGTICDRLLAEDKNLTLSVSVTTRAAGPGEIDGKDYFFYSEEDFQKTIDDDGFFEWAQVHGKRYGTLKSKVREIHDSGKDCLLEIDVQGGLQVSSRLAGACVMIFIKSPSEEELIRRISKRGRDTRESVKRRLLSAQWELSQEHRYQYTVINDDLDEAVRKVHEIIRDERRSHASTINRKTD
jgi:guanylate kinase